MFGIILAIMYTIFTQTNRSSIPFCLLDLLCDNIWHMKASIDMTETLGDFEGLNVEFRGPPLLIIFLH
jgi:hypothetical protein